MAVTIIIRISHDKCEVRIPGWPLQLLHAFAADKRELPHLIGADLRDVHCRTVGADCDAVRVAEPLKQNKRFSLQYSGTPYFPSRSCRYYRRVTTEVLRTRMKTRQLTECIIGINKQDML
jgi:hypothetical protein